MKKLLHKGFLFRLKPNADIEARLANDVGAIHILARGHRVLACGVGSLGPSMKQEPVESTRYKPTRGIVSHESPSFRWERISK